MSAIACNQSWFVCNYQWLIGSVIVPILGVSAALGAVIMAYRSLKNTNRQATQDRQNQLRPVVVPLGDLSHHKPDGSLDWELMYNLTSIATSTNVTQMIEPNTQELVLRNMADGLAFNVHCFLYGPSSRLKPEQNYTSWSNGPIQGKGEAKIIFKHEKTVLPENTKVDDENVLYDDSEPNHLIARLTITYHDLLRIKHVSIFDYVCRNRTEHKWFHVGTKNGIRSDLYELANP